MGRQGRKRRFSGRREAGEVDFELNLASIIDCFMVVITYLLFTAAFISLAELDVSAVTVGTSGQASAPAETIAVGMGEGRALNIQARGEQNLTYALPMKNGDWDVEGLGLKLDEMKKKFPSVDSLVIAAADGISYEEVVKVLESSQKIYPKVGLADLSVEKLAGDTGASL